MSTNTTNMSLVKPNTTDTVDVTQLNGNMDTLDSHDHGTNAKGLAVARIASGLDASKPAVNAAAGTAYLATDTNTWYLANGTSLVAYTSLAALLSAKGSLIGASAASTPSERMVGANGTLLVADSTQGSGLNWKALLANSVQAATSSPTMSASTWTSCGAALTPAAGTWLLLGSIQMSDGTNHSTIQARIYDGTSVVGVSAQNIMSGAPSTDYVQTVVFGIATTDGSKTYNLQGNSSYGTTAIQGGGTQLVGVRLA